MNETQNSHIGPIVGSVIVIIILIIGGLYFYGERLANPPAAVETPIENTDQSAAADPAAERLRSQGTSDESAAIEGDLNATDINSIDAEMNSDASLNF